MAKVIRSVTLDYDVVMLAIEQGLNISGCCNEALKAEVNRKQIDKPVISEHEIDEDRRTLARAEYLWEQRVENVLACWNEWNRLELELPKWAEEGRTDKIETGIARQKELIEKSGFNEGNSMRDWLVSQGLVLSEDGYTFVRKEVGRIALDRARQRAEAERNA